MVKFMQVASKSQRGPVLKLILSLADISIESGESVTSEIFNINDLAEVRFQFTSNNNNYLTYCLSYKKHDSAVDHTVKVNITCKKPNYSKQIVCPETFSGWEKLGEISKVSSYTTLSHYTTSYHRRETSTTIYWGLSVLEVTLSVYKVGKLITTFPKMFYEDNEFCDFNLTTIDGAESVPLHKACLVVHGDMFRRMLNAEWKDTTKGSIKIHGVTLQTLKHLKDYLYLGTLPDDGMELQLLLLVSKCYMVDNLKVECIMKLAETVLPEDYFSLQDFAVANQFPELSRAINLVTPDETVHSAYLMKDKKDVEAATKKSDSK